MYFDISCLYHVLFFLSQGTIPVNSIFFSPLSLTFSHPFTLFCSFSSLLLLSPKTRLSFSPFRRTVSFQSEKTVDSGRRVPRWVRRPGPPVEGPTSVRRFKGSWGRKTPDEIHLSCRPGGHETYLEERLLGEENVKNPRCVISRRLTSSFGPHRTPGPRVGSSRGTVCGPKENTHFRWTCFRRPSGFTQFSSFPLEEGITLLS